jgi:hypothetical protein
VAEQQKQLAQGSRDQAQAEAKQLQKPMVEFGAVAWPQQLLRLHISWLAA